MLEAPSISPSFPLWSLLSLLTQSYSIWFEQDVISERDIKGLKLVGYQQLQEPLSVSDFRKDQVSVTYITCLRNITVFYWITEPKLLLSMYCRLYVLWGFCCFQVQYVSSVGILHFMLSDKVSLVAVLNKVAFWGQDFTLPQPCALIMIYASFCQSTPSKISFLNFSYTIARIWTRLGTAVVPSS